MVAICRVVLAFADGQAKVYPRARQMVPPGAFTSGFMARPSTTRILRRCSALNYSMVINGPRQFARPVRATWFLPQNIMMASPCGPVRKQQELGPSLEQHGRRAQA